MNTPATHTADWLNFDSLAFISVSNAVDLVVIFYFIVCLAFFSRWPLIKSFLYFVRILSVGVCIFVIVPTSYNERHTQKILLSIWCFRHGDIDMTFDRMMDISWFRSKMVHPSAIPTPKSSLTPFFMRYNWLQ